MKNVTAIVGILWVTFVHMCQNSEVKPPGTAVFLSGCIEPKLWEHMVLFTLICIWPVSQKVDPTRCQRCYLSAGGNPLAGENVMTDVKEPTYLYYLSSFKECIRSTLWFFADVQVRTDSYIYYDKQKFHNAVVRMLDDVTQSVELTLSSPAVTLDWINPSIYGLRWCGPQKCENTETSNKNKDLPQFLVRRSPCLPAQIRFKLEGGRQAWDK